MCQKAVSPRKKLEALVVARWENTTQQNKPGEDNNVRAIRPPLLPPKISLLEASHTDDELGEADGVVGVGVEEL